MVNPFQLNDDRDRLADLGRIAGGLVHELKNPLGVILLNADLLAQQLAAIPDGPQRDKAAKRLARIQQSGRSLQDIAQAFLAYARPTKPDPEAVDLNEVLTRLIEEQAEHNARDRVEISFHPDPHVALVPADATHLTSVFRNVLVNAREALHDRAADRHILVVTRGSPGQARVVIANNGPPLPDTVASRLFEPFTTTKDSGTGLGLAIVRRLVELHHGTIAVASDPDQGVSFTFEFPTPLGPATAYPTLGAEERRSGGAEDGTLTPEVTLTPPPIPRRHKSVRKP